MATEQELLNLSRQKWDWLVNGDLEALKAHVDDQCMFVHMGATLSKSQELEVVKNGLIQYKKADIEEESVRFFGDTAILLSKMTLLAVAGGHEVTNPFMVTEVYTEREGKPKLAWLSFTRIMTPPSESR